MPDWLITVGIFAILAGVAFRIIAMMRASDAGGSAAAALHGRQLMRAHSHTFPQNWLPTLGRLCVLLGLAFVLAGVWVLLRR